MQPRKAIASGPICVAVLREQQSELYNGEKSTRNSKWKRLDSGLFASQNSSRHSADSEQWHQRRESRSSREALKTQHRYDLRHGVHQQTRSHADHKQHRAAQIPRFDACLLSAVICGTDGTWNRVMGYPGFSVHRHRRRLRQQPQVAGHASSAASFGHSREYRPEQHRKICAGRERSYHSESSRAAGKCESSRPAEHNHLDQCSVLESGSAQEEGHISDHLVEAGSQYSTLQDHRNGFRSGSSCRFRSEFLVAPHFNRLIVSFQMGAEMAHQLYVLQTLYLGLLEQRMNLKMDPQDQDSLEKIKVSLLDSGNTDFSALIQIRNYHQISVLSTLESN